MTKRAVRVTVAACVAFYVCRYGIGDPTMALYAIFGVIALGALSDVSGSMAERTRIFVVCLGIGTILVTVGSLLAVNSWAAAAGMLLIGFLVAFSSVGGPRLTGVANGLQLLYILPCFPPYAPETLPSRLSGLVIGILLLIAADRVLWPAPAPVSFRSRLVEAMGFVSAQVATVRAARMAPSPGVDRDLAQREAEARRGVEALRFSNLAPAERPAAPDVRDRGLTHAAAALRALQSQVSVLASEAARTDLSALLEPIGEAVENTRAALMGNSTPPEIESLDTAIDAQVRRHRRELATERVAEDAVLSWARHSVEETEAIDDARTLVIAARAAMGAPEPPGAESRTPFWYIQASRPRLWWRRLRGHLTLRSTYLQNAVRMALALALARLVAGELGLSHGFWMLLATLTVMRTSVTATRAALVPAVVGTTAGALIIGTVIAAGPPQEFYVVVLPFALLLALASTPILGNGAGQALFTVTVAVLFAQVSPVDWRLAEVRLAAVVLGVLVGLLIGIAAWPRGVRGEVRRVSTTCLRASADYIDDVVGRMAGKDGAERESAAYARHMVNLFESTYAQYRSERTTAVADSVDWSAVLVAMHRVLRGAHTLRLRYPTPSPLPWPAAADRLHHEGGRVADQYRKAPARLRRDAGPEVTSPAAAGQKSVLHDWMRTAPWLPDCAEHPDDAIRLIDTWGWLSRLCDDLARITRPST